MVAPLSNPGLLPAPAEAVPESFPVSVYMDRDNVDWLDQIAAETKRSRSDVVREILKAVRAQVTSPVKAKVPA